jgi:hypothetical protein
MRALIQEKYGTAPESFRNAFREKSLPLMKWTNILSFNTRAIVLFISMLADLPWIYFAFELTILNIILIYMVAKHESVCKYFITQIQANKYQ